MCELEDALKNGSADEGKMKSIYLPILSSFWVPAEGAKMSVPHDLLYQDARLAHLGRFCCPSSLTCLPIFEFVDFAQ